MKPCDRVVSSAWVPETTKQDENFPAGVKKRQPNYTNCKRSAEPGRGKLSTAPPVNTLKPNTTARHSIRLKTGSNFQIPEIERYLEGVHPDRIALWTRVPYVPAQSTAAHTQKTCSQAA
jgi:hypothetical protein